MGQLGLAESAGLYPENPHPRDRRVWLPDFITSQCSVQRAFAFRCDKGKRIWFFVANFVINIFKIYVLIKIISFLVIN